MQQQPVVPAHTLAQRDPQLQRVLHVAHGEPPGPGAAGAVRGAVEPVAGLHGVVVAEEIPLPDVLRPGADFGGFRVRSVHRVKRRVESRGEGTEGTEDGGGGGGGGGDVEGEAEGDDGGVGGGGGGEGWSWRGGICGGMGQISGEMG